MVALQAAEAQQRRGLAGGLSRLPPASRAEARTRSAGPSRLASRRGGTRTRACPWWRAGPREGGRWAAGPGGQPAEQLIRGCGQAGNTRRGRAQGVSTHSNTDVSSQFSPSSSLSGLVGPMLRGGEAGRHRTGALRGGAQSPAAAADGCSGERCLPGRAAQCSSCGTGSSSCGSGSSHDGEGAVLPDAGLQRHHRSALHVACGALGVGGQQGCAGCGLAGVARAQGRRGAGGRAGGRGGTLHSVGASPPAAPSPGPWRRPASAPLAIDLQPRVLPCDEWRIGVWVRDVIQVNYLDGPEGERVGGRRRAPVHAVRAAAR